MSEKEIPWAEEPGPGRDWAKAGKQCQGVLHPWNTYCLLGLLGLCLPTASQEQAGGNSGPVSLGAAPGPWGICQTASERWIEESSEPREQPPSVRTLLGHHPVSLTCCPGISLFPLYYLPGVCHPCALALTYCDGKSHELRGPDAGRERVPTPAAEIGNI